MTWLKALEQKSCLNLPGFVNYFFKNVSANPGLMKYGFKKLGQAGWLFRGEFFSHQA